MAFAPRPLPQETIDGLRPPLAGFPYFQYADAFPFEPDATTSPINAWWLSDASFLVYGNAAFVEESLENSPLPGQGFRLDWIGTADDNRGMVLANDRAMVLVFRGTRVQVHSLLDKAEIVLYNQADLRTDSRFFFKSSKAGRVHSGFANAFAEISERLDSILATRKPEQKLWLTGHSLGGALATLAAALAGSLGIAPTGNVDPERRSPSMFEPIHGSAFDITGKGIANPVASFWTGAMMLEHLGEKPAADLLMRAVEQVCAAGIMTPDLGGKATTAEVTRAVCEAVRGMNR